jgi:hypothetical protein
MKKIILFGLLLLFGLLSFGQNKTITNAGNSIDIYDNSILYKSLDKDGLSVRNYGQDIQFLQGGKTIAKLQFAEVKTPSYSTVDSLMTAIGVMLASAGTIWVDSIFFTGDSTYIFDSNADTANYSFNSDTCMNARALGWAGKPNVRISGDTLRVETYEIKIDSVRYYSMLTDTIIGYKNGLIVKVPKPAGSGSVGNADSLNSQPASYYVARANHTGTQAISTVTGLQDSLNAMWGTNGNTVTHPLNIIGSKNDADVVFKAKNVEVFRLDSLNGNIDLSSTAYISQSGQKLIQTPTSSTTSLNVWGGGNTTMTGARNLSMGTGAGASLTTAPDNLSIGVNAGNKQTTGGGAGQNVYIGNNAGQHNTAQYNTMVGYSAGQGAAGSSTGGYNSLFGLFAGNKLTTGQQNIAMGSTALQNATTSSSNVAIGNEAMKTHTGASGATNGLNVAVGRLALGEGNQNMYCNVALGYWAVKRLSGRDNVGIGCEALAGKDTTPTSLNNADFNIGIGHHSLHSMYTGNNNVSVGYYSGYNTATGNYNVYMGDSAARQNTSGSGNIVLGYRAGSHLTTLENRFIVGGRYTENIADDTTKSLMYGVMNNGAANQRLRINSSVTTAGNVTVGNTMTTISPLHVSGVVSDKTGIALTNATTGHTATDGARFEVNQNGRANIWNYENQDIRIGVNNAEVMRIDSMGRIGFIKQTAPSELLDFADNTAGNSRFKIAHYTDNALTNSAGITFVRSRSNTIGTAVRTLNNDRLGIISFQAANSTPAITDAAYIIVKQSGANGSAVPSVFEFYQAPSTTVTPILTYNFFYTGKLGLSNGANAAPATPTYNLSINGNAAGSLGLERHTTAANAGNNLSVVAGGAVSGGTNLNGGNAIISGGIATGNGGSSVLIQTVAANQGTGTTDRTPATTATFAGDGSLTITGELSAKLQTATIFDSSAQTTALVTTGWKTLKG